MKIKFTLKAVLLYTTLALSMCTIGGIDSLYDNGYLPIAILIIVGLIYWCHKVISGEELDVMIFNKGKYIE